MIFDEFHERSLDADLSLALCLDAASVLREDLRLLVMSATLDGARVAKLLDDAPVIVSEGRAFPIETQYLGRKPGERVEAAVATAALRALAEEKGSILAFLPGQGEIKRTAALLAERISDAKIEIAPLYSAIDRAAQDRAIAPVREPARKIVLATSIAETSLTIEGVRIVIDCGLTRAPRFEPDRGLTSLETVRVSKAAADQRRGRAGRTQPGVCYRLWEAAASGALEAFAPPEIVAADLSGLVLDLAAWGVRDPLTLRWLDPPPLPALKEARTLLREIGAIDMDGALTAEGAAIARLALPPRLAKMMVAAAAGGAGAEAAEVATLLVERGLGGNSPDLAERLERFRRERSPRAEDARRLARTFAQRAGGEKPAPTDAIDCGPLVALAFPDKIAKARGAAGEFLMANGRAAMLEPHASLARAPFLAIAEISGRAGAARIIAAAALSEADLESVAGDEIASIEEVFFDRQRAALRARKSRRLGAIILSEQNLPVPPGPELRPRARRRNRGAGARRRRDRPAALHEGAGAMARPRRLSAPRRARRRLARSFRQGAGGERQRVARALHRGPHQPRRHYARGRRDGAEGAAAFRDAAARRSRGANAFRDPGRIAHRARLCGGRRSDAVCACTGALRALAPSGAGARPDRIDAGTAFAGFPPDPDHAAICQVSGAGHGRRCGRK